MYKKVDTKLDFAGREPEVVKFWKDNDLIKKMIEKNKNGEDYTFSNIRISFKGIVASTLYDKLNATGAGIEVKIDQEGATTEYIDCSNNIGVDGENRYVFGSINVPAENKAVEVTARAYFVVGGEKVFLKATTRSLESAVTDYLSGLVELTGAQEEAVAALAAYVGIGNN